MKITAALLVLTALLLSAASVSSAKDLPDVTLSASAAIEGQPYSCVAGVPCKVTLIADNHTNKDIAFSDWSVVPKGDKSISLDVKPDEDGSKTEGKSVTQVLNMTVPESLGGKDLELICSVKAGDNTVSTILKIPVTQKYEVNMLPSRLVLMGGRSDSVGVSIINHTDQQYDCKFAFTVTNGLQLEPSDLNVKIDPLGLEAYVIRVKKNGAPSPGHYTLWVNMNDKPVDWAMIDVPAEAKKTAIKLDGKLDEWKGAQAGSIVSSAPAVVGKVRFAYDAKNLYIAVEDKSASQIRIGIDPIVDGAKTPSGGLRSDDLVLVYWPVKSGISVKLECPAKKTTASAAIASKGGCEIAIPWSEMKGIKPKAGSSIAVSVATKSGEFGGGLGGTMDPRLFVPVVLK